MEVNITGVPGLIGQLWQPGHPPPNIIRETDERQRTILFLLVDNLIGSFILLHGL